MTFTFYFVGGSDRAEIELDDAEIAQLRTLRNLVEDLSEEELAEDPTQVIDVKADGFFVPMLKVLLGRDVWRISRYGTTYTETPPDRTQLKKDVKISKVQISDYTEYYYDFVKTAARALNFLNYLDTDLIFDFIDVFFETKPEDLIRLLESGVTQWSTQKDLNLGIPNEIVCLLGKEALIRHLEIPFRIVEMCSQQNWLLQNPELFYEWKPLYLYVATNWDRLWSEYRGPKKEKLQERWNEFFYYNDLRHLLPRELNSDFEIVEVEWDLEGDKFLLAAYLNIPGKVIQFLNELTEEQLRKYIPPADVDEWVSTPLEVALVGDALDVIPILLERFPAFRIHPFSLVSSRQAFDLIFNSDLDLETNDATDLEDLRETQRMEEALQRVGRKLKDFNNPQVLVSDKTLCLFDRERVRIDIPYNEVPTDWDFDFLLWWIQETRMQIPSDSEKWINFLLEHSDSPEQMRELFDVLNRNQGINPVNLFKQMLQSGKIDDEDLTAFVDLVPKTEPLLEGALRVNRDYDEGDTYLITYNSRVPFLLESGFDVEASVDSSPLFEAADDKDSWKYIVPLLQAGADPYRIVEGKNFLERVRMWEDLKNFLLEQLRENDIDDLLEILELEK